MVLFPFPSIFHVVFFLPLLHCLGLPAWYSVGMKRLLHKFFNLILITLNIQKFLLIFNFTGALFWHLFWYWNHLTIFFLISDIYLKFLFIYFYDLYFSAMNFCFSIVFNLHLMDCCSSLCVIISLSWQSWLTFHCLCTW